MRMEDGRLALLCRKQLQHAQNNLLMNKRICCYELFIISILDHEDDEFRADGLCYCPISSLSDCNMYTVSNAAP
jgi:hypothetical protein